VFVHQLWLTTFSGSYRVVQQGQLHDFRYFT